MKYHQPPQWILKWVNWVCPNHLVDEIEGDLFEYYHHLHIKYGGKTAKRRTLKFMLFSSPRLLFQRKLKLPTPIDMYKNYLTIAIRNIRKHFGYSLINILGLSAGITACLLLTLYVSDELSYDTFNKEAESIYRVNIAYDMGSESGVTWTTPTALLPTLKNNYAVVDEGVRIFNSNMFSQSIITKGAVSYQEEGFFYADSTFFDIFSYELVAGNKATCLNEPRSVLLTEAMVVKYFADKDPLGETLTVNGNEYRITGILENIPDNSHMQFDFLASFSSLSASKREIWGSANYATYIKFNDPGERFRIVDELRTMLEEQFGNQGLSLEFQFIPLLDIHLYSNVKTEMQPQNDIRYIYIISIVGLLILVIACINYMNLSTARSMDRAREVGMRKVLGAKRNQVYAQFMGESFLITTIAMVLGLLLVYFMLPFYNDVTGKNLLYSHLFQAEIILSILCLYLFISFAAGAYPSFSLSAFAPSDVLKGQFKRSAKGQLLRQLLVIVQFSISILLIISTIVIYNQLDYMRNKKLGYDKENVIILPYRGIGNKYEALQATLEKRQDVAAVTSASESPVEIGGGYTISMPGIDNPMNVQAITVGANFLDALSMNLISGRDFTYADYQNVMKDSARTYAFIVNNSFVKEVMSDEDDILKTPVQLNGRTGEIVGVVEDFHFSSLHSQIGPLVMFIEPWQFNKLFIRVQPNDIRESLVEIEQDWKTVLPDVPFVFEFMDEEYDSLYKNDARLGQVFVLFATLAIVIACLGLFGLVAFAVQQRTKEIGIRKILGASITGLFLLISKDFARLVVISYIISAPLGYWIMTQWLNDFNYKIELGVLPLVIALVLAIIITFVTISNQSLKAARMNPVETLRSE